MSSAGKTELGHFLRARRLRLDPAALGVMATRRRRTPGLRREEVAELAGIGTDWYVRLEQGRDVNPSVTTIDALARALRLTDAERDHVHQLARTGRRAAFTMETVPATLERIVRALEVPAYVTGQRWDILAWNAAAAALFMDFGRLPPGERNILLYMLTDADARRLFGDTWAAEARRMVAQFRMNFGIWAGDPAFEALVALLQQRNPHFQKWWHAHDISPQAAGRKTLHHATRGTLFAEYATLQANDDQRLKLVMYLVSASEAPAHAPEAPRQARRIRKIP